MEIIYNLNSHLVNHNYESIETLNICKELHDKNLQYNDKDLYEILITFQTKEKTKKKLIIKIEYINKESNESVFNFSLAHHLI